MTMNKYVSPIAEEVKFLAVNVIMASANPEETTEGGFNWEEGGDAVVPDVGGNT